MTYGASLPATRCRIERGNPFALRGKGRMVGNPHLNERGALVAECEKLPGDEGVYTLLIGTNFLLRWNQEEAVRFAMCWVISMRLVGASASKAQDEVLGERLVMVIPVRPARTGEGGGEEGGVDGVREGVKDGVGAVHVLDSYGLLEQMRQILEAVVTPMGADVRRELQGKDGAWIQALVVDWASKAEGNAYLDAALALVPLLRHFLLMSKQGSSHRSSVGSEGSVVSLEYVTDENVDAVRAAIRGTSLEEWISPCTDGGWTRLEGRGILGAISFEWPKTWDAFEDLFERVPRAVERERALHRLVGLPECGAVEG